MDKVLRKLLRNGGFMDERCKKYIYDQHKESDLHTTIDLEF